MLVEHHAVEAELLGQHLVVEILIEKLRALDRIEVTVGHTEEALDFQNFVLGNVMVRPFSEVHYVHIKPSVSVL